MCNYALRVGLYRISASANPESGNFSEIRWSPAPAKFLAGFVRWQCSCSMFTVQLIADKTNTADLRSGVFAILVLLGR